MKPGMLSFSAAGHDAVAQADSPGSRPQKSLSATERLALERKAMVLQQQMGAVKEAVPQPRSGKLSAVERLAQERAAMTQAANAQKEKRAGVAASVATQAQTVAHVTTLFRQFDADNSGFLELCEVEQFCHKIGLHLTPEQVRSCTSPYTVETQMAY